MQHEDSGRSGGLVANGEPGGKKIRDRAACLGVPAPGLQLKVVWLVLGFPGC
jgi:hypothetical protein